MIGVYFFPLLGGWIADRFFGKYHTVFWLSLVYCAGHACLAMFDDNRNGFFLGLFLIALGSGGIKPLVASFVGDQFDQSSKHLAQEGIRCFLLDHQLRILLRLVADAAVPQTVWSFSRLRHSRGVDADRHHRLLEWPRQVYSHPAVGANPDSFTRVVRTALFAAEPGRRAAGSVLATVGAVLAIDGLF